MTEVLHSPPHFASTPRTSSSSSSPFSCHAIFRSPSQPHFSLLALLVTLLRKSFIACKSGSKHLCSTSMDIGSPTNVRHVAHVTFDRFNGFLGLPVEFEPEVSRRPPSASATVFGVSTESMQLSYDSRGNSVPTILLLMQRHLYNQGGLQVEGIFRINPDNGKEEHVRDQLNMGLVPEDVDVHCLAGLIKAWFRELPKGVLDSLSPEQVMQSQNEEECAQLVRHLPHTEASLLDWAINLMADVVQQEHLNKMNARNIAMVFAPNMTQMADPITALMYAVQVMNFLKTLILRTLRERKDSVIESYPRYYSEPSNDSTHHRLSNSSQQDTPAEIEEAQEENIVSEKTVLECSLEPPQNNEESNSFISTSEIVVCNEDLYCEFPPKGNKGKSKTYQASSSNNRKGTKNTRGQKKGNGSFKRIDSRTDEIKAWK